MNINVGYDAVRGMTFRRMSRDLARDTGNMNDPVVMVTEVEISIMSLKGDDFLYTYACNNKLIPIEDASVTFYIVDGEDTVRKPKWLAYYNKNENRRAGYKLNTSDISAIKKSLDGFGLDIQKLLLEYREIISKCKMPESKKKEDEFKDLGSIFGDIFGDQFKINRR